MVKVFASNMNRTIGIVAVVGLTVYSLYVISLFPNNCASKKYPTASNRNTAYDIVVPASSSSLFLQLLKESHNSSNSPGKKTTVYTLGDPLCNASFQTTSWSSAASKKNVIAYSLYGASKRYLDVIPRVQLYAHNNYPHWTVRFFVPAGYKHKSLILNPYKNTEVWSVTGTACPNPMWWRFYFINDPSVDATIVRDVDSILTKREARAVASWIASGKPMHVMRDSKNGQDNAINGGMFGVRHFLKLYWPKLIQDWISGNKTSNGFAKDLKMLDKVVFDKAVPKSEILQHDSHTCRKWGALPFPDNFLDDGKRYVGEALTKDMKNIFFNESEPLSKRRWNPPPECTPPKSTPEREHNCSQNSTNIIPNMPVFSVSNERPVICIGLSITSRNIEKRALDMHPIVKFVSRSLAQTAEPNKFKYILAAGFDEGDPVYDSQEKRDEVQRLILNETKSLDVDGNGGIQISWSRHYHNRVQKSVSARVASDTLKHCYDMDADYLYRINDDVVFLTKGWTSKMVNELQNRPIPNHGMTCASFKEGASGLCVTDFTHRSHHNIFPHHYPRVFFDWYCDNWMTQAYGKLGTTYSKKLTDVKISHVITDAGQRYKETTHAVRKGGALEREIENSASLRRSFFQNLFAHAGGVAVMWNTNNLPPRN